MKLLLISIAVAAVSAAPVNKDPTPPHLSQAWIAESKGDGLKGQIGKESYIYDSCGKHGKGPYTPDCMRGHIFDYGPSCTKYEIDGGYHYEGTGIFYVGCDAVDCCYDDNDDPDPKQWDILPSSWWASRKTTYGGKHDTTELNGKNVTGADVWNVIQSVPLTGGKIGINYTYFVTKEGNDTITHRINYSVPGDSKVQAGAILYGDFQPQHDLATFRKTFMPPAVCLGKGVMSCGNAQLKKWNTKYPAMNMRPFFNH